MPKKCLFICKKLRIWDYPYISPNINTSQIHFKVIDGALLFGLQGIKNVGLAALETIIEERKKQPYKDLFDFCIRVDLRTVNKRVIESLICAGAFDQLPGNRAQKYEELSIIMDKAVERKKALATGQLGLFDSKPSASSTQEYEGHIFAPRAEWDIKQQLEKEREVIGFYLSAHPLDPYQHYLRWLPLLSFEQALTNALQKKSAQEQPVITYGLITTSKQVITKKGDRMAFLHCEDTVSKAEIIIFPQLFKKVESWLTQYRVFIIKGVVDVSATQCKIKANELVPAELFFQEWSGIKSIYLTLPNQFEESLLTTIKERLVNGKVPLSLIFSDAEKKLCLKTKQSVALDAATIHHLEQHKIKVTVVPA